MPTPPTLDLDRALARARHQRPAALPPDFADSVMLRARRDLPGPPAFSPAGFALAAAAAVLAAALIGSLVPRGGDSPRPQLTLFGGQPGHSPFVNP